MCGRFNLVTDSDSWLDAFGVALDTEVAAYARYNIAPCNSIQSPNYIPVIRAGIRQREVANVIWPLIPSWGKTEIPKFSTANARSETVAGAPAYRHAWKNNQRCLIPASGFYEWKIIPGKKRKEPYHIMLPDSPLFAFGGLWEFSENESGERIESCTIITVEANDLVSTVHNRMPFIVPPEYYDQWLNGSGDSASALIKPYPETEMDVYPITEHVNNPENDDAECLRRR